MLRVGCTESGRKAVPRQMAAEERPLAFLHRTRLMVHRFFYQKKFSEGAGERCGQNACCEPGFEAASI